MGVFGRIKNAVSNFYGGNGQDDEDDFEEENQPDLGEDEEMPDDNPSGYGEDETPAQKESQKEEENAPDEKEVKGMIASAKKKMGSALMRKEAIVHECSSRVEAVPCPVCHQKSIFKSKKVFDWVPLLLGARVVGVTLYRYYCFNKSCSKSYYKNYVFNCNSPKFTPASVPTKRQFNAS